MRYCSLEHCNNLHEAQGYCKKHYKSLLLHGDPLQVDENIWIREEIRLIKEQMEEDALKQGLEITTRGTIKTRASSREGVCSVAGCGGEIKARHLCEKHYTRLRRHGTTKSGRDRFAGLDKCLVFNCKNKYLNSGFCATHKVYQIKFGTPYIRKKKTFCGVEEGCDNVHLAKGFCKKHYNTRYNINKDIAPLEPKVIELCGADGCHEIHEREGLCVEHLKQWAAIADKYDIK